MSSCFGMNSNSLPYLQVPQLPVHTNTPFEYFLPLPSHSLWCCRTQLFLTGFRTGLMHIQMCPLWLCSHCLCHLATLPRLQVPVPKLIESFLEVSPTYDKLYAFKRYNLRSWEMCLNMWKHHPHSKYPPHPKFPVLPCNAFFLPLSTCSPWWPLTCLLPLQINLHFL